MEEDEVSLKDYIRVVKKEKILVTSIFLGAVVFASVYSFLLPDEYLQEARLSYVADQEIPLTDVVEMLKSPSIIQEIAGQEGDISQKDALSILGALKVENIRSTNLILIQLRGYNPELMKEYFGQYLKVALSGVNKKKFEMSIVNNSRLVNLYILYAKQREETKAEMGKKLVEEADLEIRRLENLSVITARIGSKDKQAELEFKLSELKSIKEGSQSSGIAQQLISSNQDLKFLNLRLNSINEKLVDLENKKAELENLDQTVMIMTIPPADPSIIGPKRGLNISIAAVLGLLTGVFAAFFKNYLEESVSE